MKLLKIILKNIKLLMRSRISAFVIILAPLLIILLVGLSFSTTSSFFIDIGVYAGEYTELTESFIQKLNSESFSITRYNNQEECINDIKFGVVHTCIIFPEDLSIESETTNQILFYVDQSKINLVYLIINTLSGSISDRSSEISFDLASSIVDTLFDTKNNIEVAIVQVDSSIQNNDEVEKDSVFSYEKLNTLDLSIPEKADVGLLQEPMDKILDTLNETKIQAILATKKGLDMIEYINENYPSINVSEFDEFKDKFVYINKTVLQEYDDIFKDINGLSNVVDDLEENIDALVNKLSVAKMGNRDVLPRLEAIKKTTESIREGLQEARDLLSKSVNNINSIPVTAPEKIVSPISMEIKPVVKEKTALNYLFPSLIVLLVMFVGLMLPSLLIIIEKNSQSFFRVFTTPTKDYVFIITNYLTTLIFLFIQLLIIFLVSEVYFKVELFAKLSNLMLLMWIIATVFIFLGMLIGYLFNSEEIATLASVSVGSMFLLTSGIIFPIEGMPSYILDKVKFNPFVLSSELFKKILLFNVNVLSVSRSLIILFTYSLILIVLIVLVEKFSKLKFLHQIPTKKQLQREIIEEYFQKEGNLIINIDEFVSFVKTMTDDELKSALNENAVVLWLRLVLNNRKLAKKIQELESQTKEAVLGILEQELHKYKS
ncbi:ABC transporter permease [Candidatus Woesearchaeota archaeon]|nr:ABC transporter permease [Candidatus Woesearchaeota archaeon]